MTFFSAHGADGEIRKSRLYYLGLTTALASVVSTVASGSHTVTPSSMDGVVNGATLHVSNADGTSVEDVVVTGTTLTTFTATFAHAHTANWLFNVPDPQYWTDYELDIKTTGAPAGSHLWKAMPITPGTVQTAPEGNTTSFTLADADGSVLRLIADKNGAELADLVVYEAGFLLTNKTAVPDEVLEIVSGRVDRASVDTTNTDAITFTSMPPVQNTTGKLPTRLISTLLRT